MVVVVDGNNHRLALWRLVDDTVWRHLGTHGTAPGQFTYPNAVALTGSGDLVVTDQGRVQVLSVDGAVLSVLDSTMVTDVGQLGEVLLGVAVCSGTDEIFVTDRQNHRIIALTWSPPSHVRFFFFSSILILFYFSPGSSFSMAFTCAGRCRSVGRCQVLEHG